MTNSLDIDKRFAGSIPELYDTLLVPLIFEPYATDMARRVAALEPASVLEVAAGTGALTRALAQALPASARIVATDLNQAMLDRAQAIGLIGDINASRPVHWQQADAMRLPFPDAAFDVIVCQFGAMFFPDKPKAFAELRRALKPGGTLVFSVWDRIEDNAFAHVVTDTLARTFPASPPRFLARTPHGYHNRAAIERDVRLGGFTAALSIDTVTLSSRARSPRTTAIAYCQGSPLRHEIDALGDGALSHATDTCEAALADAFGAQDIEGGLQAHVIAARAPGA